MDKENKNKINIIVIVAVCLLLVIVLTVCLFSCSKNGGFKGHGYEDVTSNTLSDITIDPDESTSENATVPAIDNEISSILSNTNIAQDEEEINSFSPDINNSDVENTYTLRQFEGYEPEKTTVKVNPTETP